MAIEGQGRLFHAYDPGAALLTASGVRGEAGGRYLPSHTAVWQMRGGAGPAHMCSCRQGQLSYAAWVRSGEPALPSFTAGEGLGKGRREEVIFPSPMQTEGAELLQISHPRPRGQLAHTPSNRINYVVTLRGGAGPALLSSPVRGRASSP